MSYKALYLTYRPQSFDEVAGQRPIVRTLKNALTSEKMAHAYLFAGPRGTGKTSMARLFAKALNCEEGIGHECNHCSNCTAVIDGSHPDVIEIDAASNNGVDQIRDLIEKVKYAPIRGRFKVYIIDEVHMMTPAAFNALLKTLEEPPEQVIFVLCTTEPYKVLPTIVSRCQRFDFGKITETEMEARLKQVLAKEGATCDETALKTIIRLADGGMRDSLSILDQALAYAGTHLSEKDLLDIYGLTSVEEKIELLKAVREGDVSAVVQKSERYLTAGTDIRRLVLDLINILKDVLIYQKTKTVGLLNELSLTEAKDMAKRLSVSDCNAMISALIEAQNNFKNVSDVRSLFELTLLQMASEHDQTPSVKETTEEEVIPVTPKETKREEPAPVPQEKHEEAPKVQAEVAPVAKEAIVEEKIVPSFDRAPAFLFEDEPQTEAEPAPKAEEVEKPIEKKEETPKPEAAPALDLSPVKNTEVVDEGTTFTLTHDQLIGIMTLGAGRKKERKELLEKWSVFETLILDEKVGSLAGILRDATPFVLCEEALILSYKQNARAAKANIMENQDGLQQLVATLLGRRVFIYGIGPNERTVALKEYYARQAASKLPKVGEINLNLPK